MIYLLMFFVFLGYAAWTFTNYILMNVNKRLDAIFAGRDGIEASQLRMRPPIQKDAHTEFRRRHYSQWDADVDRANEQNNVDQMIKGIMEDDDYGPG